MAALAQWTNVGMIDNSVNEMEVHIQQTNDRLQCIRQVTRKPPLEVTPTTLAAFSRPWQPA